MSDWHQEETYKSLIQIGVNALRFVVIANGGAAIALLAFLGKIYEPGKVLPDVTTSLGWFLAGVFLGGIAHYTAYMTQLSLFNENMDLFKEKLLNNHSKWLTVSLVIVVSSIICFGVGAWLGVNTII